MNVSPKKYHSQDWAGGRGTKKQILATALKYFSVWIQTKTFHALCPLSVLLKVLVETDM
jgi:hypothetical protein